MEESATKCSEREGSAMLMGTYEHSIDTKNRLIIPAKLKEQLGANITIIKDTDKCLCLYSEEEWQKYKALPTRQPMAEFTPLKLPCLLTVKHLKPLFMQ